MHEGSVLAVSDLGFRHERNQPRQVDDVSFSLRAGRTFGVLGGNECGKTTLAQLLLGNLTPERGSVTVLGGKPALVVWPRWRGVVRTLLTCSVIFVALIRATLPAQLAWAWQAGAWCVMLLLALLEGTAHVDGRRYGAREKPTADTGEAPAAMLRRGVAYLSSEHDAGQKLPAEMTIEEAIGRHMPLPKSAKTARRREVKAALEAAGFRIVVGGAPHGDAERYLSDGLKCGELSGGQKHLIYLLSVLASRPRVLICDECLCGLDIDRQSSVVQLLQKLQLKFKIAILFLTVDLTSFTLMAHEAAFMSARGTFLETGSAHDIVERPLRRDTQEYVRASQENEARSRGKNLRNAFQHNESVFNL